MYNYSYITDEALGIISINSNSYVEGRLIMCQVGCDCIDIYTFV